MKNLKELLHQVRVVKFRGQPDSDIRYISFDTRQVGADDVFVALKGTKSDGHDFIPVAVNQGAKAVICERLPEIMKDDVCYVEVEDSHEALGIIASAFYGNPSGKLKLIGVTGTNGKTTIATLLFRISKAIGYKAGLLSTIAVVSEERSRTATHTTPDPLQINQALYEMANEGCEYAFMEVSSHSAAQNRIAGLTFSGGIFTNLTHDHLDYHKDFKAYLEAKRSFFNVLPEDAFALFNADDKNGRIIVQNTRAAKYSYGLKTMADFRASVIESHLEGNLLRIENHEIWTKLPGLFNAYNVLAVYTAAVLSGMPENNVLKAISEQSSVPGRFDIIKSERGITGIVDYAHTPDALENVLNAINRIRSSRNRVITIVGAGGNRDKEKRPLMAKIGAEMSDRLILTSDNPRDEDPDDIIKDMKKGVDNAFEKNVLTITDREEAIRTACAFAVKGDIILLAGKGHEDYQEVRGVKRHFDDKEVLLKYMK